jgi:hypothetical protein
MAATVSRHLLVVWQWWTSVGRACSGSAGRRIMCKPPFTARTTSRRAARCTPLRETGRKVSRSKTRAGRPLGRMMLLQRLRQIVALRRYQSRTRGNRARPGKVSSTPSTRGTCKRCRTARARWRMPNALCGKNRVRAKPLGNLSSSGTSTATE